MNLKRRLRISWVAVWVIRVRFRCWWLIAHLMAIPCFLTIALIKMKCNYRVEAWKKASYSWRARVNSFCADCYATSQAGEGHTEVSRQRLLATQSALLAEHERLQEAAAELKSDGGSSVMTYMLVSVQDGIFRSARKRETFFRILSQIENSPTFYWDLLLWFVTPSPYSDVLLGDLSEEYQLRNAIEGEALARAWYGHQVITTLRDFLWKKIERLAAIGTLIDMVGRWFRN